MNWPSLPRTALAIFAGTLAVALGAGGCGDAATPARSSAAATPSRQAVPILTYHHIGSAPPGARSPALWVSPAEWRDQLRALQRAGYRGVTLRQVRDAWEHGARLPQRPIVVTFDDGYAEQVSRGLPALRDAGWPAVLNLTLANLPQLGGTRAVRRLIAAGWEIDSHTLTHPDLTTVPDDELRRELTESRERITRLFGQPADVFCYPFGHYDARVVAAVRAAGYHAATTTVSGLARPSQPFVLRRIGVTRGKSGAALVRRLAALRR